jgi:hypothetical protein
VQAILKFYVYLVNSLFMIISLRFILHYFFDDLLRLLNVFWLAKILHDTICLNEIDPCIIFNDLFGIFEFFCLIIRNLRDWLFRLDILSHIDSDSFNGILNIYEISDNYI